MSEDQELIPIEQPTEDGEQLPQSGLEEAEATSERALVPLQVSQLDFFGDGLTVVLVMVPLLVTLPPLSSRTPKPLMLPALVTVPVPRDKKLVPISTPPAMVPPAWLLTVALPAEVK